MPDRHTLIAALIIYGAITVLVTWALTGHAYA